MARPPHPQVTVDQEAWSEWERLATVLRDRGFGELVAQHQPPTGAGWLRVAEHEQALRKAVSQARAAREGRA